MVPGPKSEKDSGTRCVEVPFQAEVLRGCLVSRKFPLTHSSFPGSSDVI